MGIKHEYLDRVGGERSIDFGTSEIFTTGELKTIIVSNVKFKLTTEHQYCLQKHPGH